MTPLHALECKTPPQTRGRLRAHDINNRADKKVEFDHQTFDGPVAEGWLMPSFLRFWTPVLVTGMENGPKDGQVEITSQRIRRSECS